MGHNFVMNLTVDVLLNMLSTISYYYTNLASYAHITFYGVEYDMQYQYSETAGTNIAKHCLNISWVKLSCIF